MLYTIQNDFVKAVFLAKGAELTSLFHLQHQMEYMWNGDPEFWGKHSPVLFPIVGTLKENKYIFNGLYYHLSRHGFARDKVFEVDKMEKDSIRFVLRSNSETLASYPFHFEFYIHYTLQLAQLTVAYEVINKGSGPMYFSVGAHPAFALPLVAGTLYEDYYLEFEQEEDAGRWLIDADGLIENETVPLLEKTNILPLSKSLFYKDAIVLKALHSQYVQLKSKRTKHGLVFYFKDFPYLGIWAAKNASFVCIEPWCGIADQANSNQVLETKEGIQQLEAGAHFTVAWKLGLC